MSARACEGDHMAYYASVQCTSLNAHTYSLFTSFENRIKIFTALQGKHMNLINTCVCLKCTHL